MDITLVQRPSGYPCNLPPLLHCEFSRWRWRLYSFRAPLSADIAAPSVWRRSSRRRFRQPEFPRVLLHFFCSSKTRRRLTAAKFVSMLSARANDPAVTFVSPADYYVSIPRIFYFMSVETRKRIYMMIDYCKQDFNAFYISRECTTSRLSSFHFYVSSLEWS